MVACFSGSGSDSRGLGIVRGAGDGSQNRLDSVYRVFGTVPNFLRSGASSTT